MRKALVVGIAICALAVPACGGGDTGATPSPASSYSAPTPSPLAAPSPCRPGSSLKLFTSHTTWADAGGHPYAPGKACLSAPASAFTVTVDNTLPPPGSDRANHNLTIYTDASASETVFRGDAVALGDAHTFHVPALAKGLYFFRCDIHPLPMTGVVVVG